MQEHFFTYGNAPHLALGNMSGDAAGSGNFKLRNPNTPNPEEGMTDEYKTSKMVFWRIEPGTFTIGCPEDELGQWTNERQHVVTLTQPHFMRCWQD